MAIKNQTAILVTGGNGEDAERADTALLNATRNDIIVLSYRLDEVDSSVALGYLDAVVIYTRGSEWSNAEALAHGIVLSSQITKGRLHIAVVVLGKAEDVGHKEAQVGLKFVTAA